MGNTAALISNWGRICLIVSAACATKLSTCRMRKSVHLDHIWLFRGEIEVGSTPCSCLNSSRAAFP